MSLLKDYFDRFGLFFGYQPVHIGVSMCVLLIYMDFAFFFLVFSWVFISPEFSIEILDVYLDLLCECGLGVTLKRETLVM